MYGIGSLLCPGEQAICHSCRLDHLLRTERAFASKESYFRYAVRFRYSLFSSCLCVAAS